MRNFTIKLLLCSFIFILSFATSYAFEIITPDDKNNETTSNNALILGKASNLENVYINGYKVPVAQNGAFAHSIKLKNGENRIFVKSDYCFKIYNLFKKEVISSSASELKEFVAKPVLVKKDNTPLRSTPVDAGLNRLSHLFKDTTLLVDGFYNGFYRVRLSKDDVAWISENSVREYGVLDRKQIASFVNMDSTQYKNAVEQTISFTKKLPFTIEEKEHEILFKIYNPEFSDSSVYTLNIPKPQKYYYHVYSDNGVYTFKVCELPYDFQNLTVVIDPGHGGSERGAIGCLGDLEKDINLKIGLELQKTLKELGFNVIMTRESDGNVSLSDRVEVAKENNADIFISIHLNSIPDVPFNIHKHKGTSVYFYNPNSKNLAEMVEQSVVKSANTRKDGVHSASLAVIRPSDYIGILVECAYMINPYDSVLYTSNNFASNIANGIKEGLVKYITEN